MYNLGLEAAFHYLIFRPPFDLKYLAILILFYIVSVSFGFVELFVLCRRL